MGESRGSASCAYLRDGRRRERRKRIRGRARKAVVERCAPGAQQPLPVRRRVVQKAQRNAQGAFRAYLRRGVRLARKTANASAVTGSSDTSGRGRHCTEDIHARRLQQAGGRANLPIDVRDAPMHKFPGTRDMVRHVEGLMPQAPQPSPEPGAAEREVRVTEGSRSPSIGAASNALRAAHRPRESRPPRAPSRPPRSPAPPRTRPWCSAGHNGSAERGAHSLDRTCATSAWPHIR